MSRRCSHASSLSGRATARIVAIAGSLLVSAAALAQVLGGSYENKQEGFSIKLPKEFEVIPPSKLGEPWVVTEMQGPHLIEYGKSFQMRYPSYGWVLRFGGPAPEPNEEEAPERGKAEDIKAAMKRYGPKSAKEWIEGRLQGQVLKEKEFTAGSRKGRLTEFTFEGSGGGAGWQGVCASFPTDEGEIAVAYGVLKGHFAKWSPSFTASFKSLKLLERAARRSDLARNPQASAREKVLAEVEESIKGLKGWYAVPTEHYVILSNTDRELVNEVGRHLELIRKKYEELFPPTKKIEAISRVRICKNEADYYKNGGPGGSAGVWKAYDEELIIFDDTVRNKAYTFSTMYHEAFHQYIHYACGELAPHDWFNEGSGDFFGGAKLKGSQFEIGKNDWRTETIRNAVRSGEFIPLEKFIVYTHREYYGPKMSICYAQGWCFVYFLRTAAKNPRWREIPETYFKVLRDTNDAQKAAGKNEHEAGEAARKAAIEAAFDGVNVAELEKVFLEFAKAI